MEQSRMFNSVSDVVLWSTLSITPAPKLPTIVDSRLRVVTLHRRLSRFAPSRADRQVGPIAFRKSRVSGGLLEVIMATNCSNPTLLFEFLRAGLGDSCATASSLISAAFVFAVKKKSFAFSPRLTASRPACCLPFPTAAELATASFPRCSCCPAVANLTLDCCRTGETAVPALSFASRKTDERYSKSTVGFPRSPDSVGEDTSTIVAAAAEL
mmetsp:Transcript_30988/g.71412  ORF Transcript_30988/g.71412 Transcript_30988/m.71412 type:complete len:212 (-) Transcript_30988:125-760(-)